MKVGAANRRERDANDSFAGPRAWLFYLFNPNLVLTMENICFHCITLFACFASSFNA
jgi:hypothetical protein